MLSTRWVVFIVSLWVSATFCCNMCEGAGWGAQEQTLIDSLMNCQIFTADDTFGKVFGIFNPDLWVALLKAAFFDYAIFYGNWRILQVLLLWPITMAMIVTLAMQALRIFRGGG